MLTFFMQKPKVKESQIDTLISTILTHFKHQSEIAKLITQKQWIFQHQITLSKRTSEKEAILLCYALFANTLMNCINSPEDIPELIRNYYSSSDYRHIGGDNGCYSFTLFDEVNNALLKASIAALVLSLITLPFSVPVGIIALGITLSTLLPTAFYALAETLPNQMQVKKEEDQLFNEVLSNLYPRELLESDNPHIAQNDPDSTNLAMVH
ncbi:hypothetical protein [Legionella brunensis]|uniref:23, 7 kDa protein n=1 Tax=Legionella brunensis TaxID=29422 RepID=A0A0W0ST77_9GAMM|nr:hypothetical protein [Legionella brunensis]KTC86603.1 23, 7 kDa protein [Legionella brunensis]